MTQPATTIISEPGEDRNSRMTPLRLMESNEQLLQEMASPLVKLVCVYHMIYVLYMVYFVDLSVSIFV